MKRLWWMALLVWVPYSLASPCDAGRPSVEATAARVELAGEYRLDDVDGVVSALVLRVDGGFEWSLRSIDLAQHASGRWDRRPGEVALVPDRPVSASASDLEPRPSPAFEVMILAVEGGDLISPQIGGRYVRVRP